MLNISSTECSSLRKSSIEQLTATRNTSLLFNPSSWMALAGCAPTIAYRLSWTPPRHHHHRTCRSKASISSNRRSSEDPWSFLLQKREGLNFSINRLERLMRCIALVQSAITSKYTMACDGYCCFPPPRRVVVCLCTSIGTCDLIFRHPTHIAHACAKTTHDREERNGMIVSRDDRKSRCAAKDMLRAHDPGATDH